MKMNGAQALTQSILSYGVDTIFGLPGAQLDYLFDAFHAAQGRLRVIHTRHEQGSAYMAFGYAQATGRVGTLAVVPGPGVLNASAGLCTAHGCNAPVLCLAGQIPSRWMGKGTGQLHELDDQMGAVASLTKWRGRAESAAQAPGKVREAFVALNTGRRRPAFLEMAPDVMARTEEVSLLPPVSDFAALDPDAADDLIEQAAALIGNAESPGIFVGGGIYGAEAELLALAREIQAPVFMSPDGFGAVDWRDPLAQNWVVGKEMWPSLDVVVAVGTRLLVPLAGWGLRPGMKMIRIDVDPEQSVNLAKPDVHIVTTAKKALAKLADRARRHNRKRTSRAEALSEAKAAAHRRYARLQPQAAFADVIRRELDEDGIAVFCVTQVGFYAQFGFPVYKPRTIIQPGLQGTLGYSFPAALGAKVAHPDRQVVCCVGDGGFMFNVQELATAILHRINVVTVVFRDDAFGNVRRNQRDQFGARHIADALRNPDFVKLAESFGAVGMRVETPDALGRALKEAFRADAPVVIEVPVGEMPSAWEFLPLLRAADQSKEKAT